MNAEMVQFSKSGQQVLSEARGAQARLQTLPRHVATEAMRVVLGIRVDTFAMQCRFDQGAGASLRNRACSASARERKALKLSAREGMCTIGEVCRGALEIFNMTTVAECDSVKELFRKHMAWLEDSKWSLKHISDATFSFHRTSPRPASDFDLSLFGASPPPPPPPGAPGAGAASTEADAAEVAQEEGSGSSSATSTSAEDCD